jgi:hypothetical protein
MKSSARSWWWEVGISFGLLAALVSARVSSEPSVNEGSVQMNKATGAFEVQMQPLGALDSVAGVPLARLSLAKQFAGDLVGEGHGEMLTARTQTQGSAGYVAMERFTGTLQGRKGSFVFQHSAQMNRGAPQMSITVVPDSGTEALAGITGVFKINIVEGKHFYEFEYSLP